MRREYPDHPIIGVGGIIYHGDAVLLVKRGQEPGKGQWSLPGGVVELGETLIEALKREIDEEVSIRVEVFDLVRLLDRIIYDKENRIRFHYVIADYWGRMISGHLKPASDISEACFVSLNQLKVMGIHQEVEKTILMAEKFRNNFV
jgi:mutator protein MutT